MIIKHAVLIDLEYKSYKWKLDVLKHCKRKITDKYKNSIKNRITNWKLPAEMYAFDLILSTFLINLYSLLSKMSFVNNDNTSHLS